MYQRRWLQNQVLKRIALTTCLLGLSLGFSSDALAGYKPPRDRSRPRTPPGSWTSRGCDTQNSPTTPNPQVPLTLLAPHSHIGATTSTHPTFAWFIPEQKSYPIELTLFEYSAGQGRGQAIRTLQLNSSPGIMQLALPPDQPGLTVGKSYVWQVALICSRTRPSKNPWVEAIVEVVLPPTALQTTLSQTTNPLQRSQQYAEAGFWYEALAEALKAPNAQSWRQLLMDLSKLESSEQQKRLEAVMESDRSFPTSGIPRSN